MKEEPRLFIDMSFKQHNQILMYGVSDLLNASGPVQQTKSNIGSHITRALATQNTNQEATSGSSRSNSISGLRNVNRTEGGGNTNNKNNRGILGRIFGGTKKPANSGTVIKKPVINSAASVAGSSSGSVSRNNNNNNVSQPNPNTTRNKLIQNLKKKNLSNFVVNGLMRSYDNKKRTANEIIREANNLSKKIAAGETAQRKSTLRPR